MKTKICCLVIFFIIPVNFLLAQENQRPLRFMLLAEPQISWLHADEPHLTDGPIRAGVEGGFRLDYSFDRFYAVSFGVGLNQTGGSLISADTLFLDRINGFDTLVPQTRLTYRLQYVEFPVAIKFKTPQIGYMTWFAEVGLDPMINTRVYIDATDNSILKEPFQQGVRQFNLGYHLGLGTVYSFGNSMGLQISALYRNSFLDVTKENKIRKSDNTRINQVGLSIGLIF